MSNNLLYCLLKLVIMGVIDHVLAIGLIWMKFRTNIVFNLANRLPKNNRNGVKRYHAGEAAGSL